MRLTIEKTQLLKALSHAQSVVEKRHTIPILGHVLLDAEGGTLTLTSTDMELNLIEKIPAMVEEPGQLTVAASMFFDIIRKVDAETVLLFVKENQIHIHAGRSKFKIAFLNADDFPKLSFGDLPITFTLKADQLKKLFDKPRFAMATEETRYYLNGIYWHTIPGDNLLRAVATDAHRLAFTQITAPSGSMDMPGVIIGRKTVNEARKLLDEDASGDVKVSLSAQRIEFHFSSASLSSRLIDGNFPDYMQAIPLENNCIFFVPTKQYASAVDRVATVVSDKIRVIKLELNENQVTLSALSSELGSAHEDIPVDYQSTDAVEIGFNAKYLLDITQQIDEEETEVALSDGNSPALIKGVGNTESVYVIMPMRI
ncbi:MAG: DNA polymerase III subunit beta [Alphaproteobacteria bacterium]|nr:DNA polymerase III subunit beta [Alphaproteobacteria bacterium]